MSLFKEYNNVVPEDSGNVFINHIDGTVWSTGRTSVGNTYITKVGNSGQPGLTPPIFAQPGPDYQNGYGDVVIRRPDKPDLAVASTLDMIMDRLCIIEPSFKLMNKYPALKEAYDAYKAIEAMCSMGDKEDE